MLYSKVKWPNFLLGFAFITLLSLIIPAKECHAAGLNLTKITNSTSSNLLIVTGDPSQNTNIPLDGYFTPTFSNSVCGYFDGSSWPTPKPYTIDNTSKVKLERIVNGSTTPEAITFDATNTAMKIIYPNLIPSSEYILTLEGDVTNADGTVTKGITANNNNFSLGSKVVIGFTTVEPTAPAAPSLASATLVSDTLILTGLPSNATNLEYRLVADGSNYTEDWSALTVTNQSAVISGQGLSAGTSKVQVRVQADHDTNTPAGASAELTIAGTVLPTPEAPSVQSAVMSGMTITLTGLPSGATNLEYSISENGTDFVAWKDLSIEPSATQGSIDTTGYAVDTGVSKIGVRVKADNSGTLAGEIAETGIVLALNVETPLVEGKTYVFESGIKLYAEELNEGDNTVTVRDAKNQVINYDDDSLLPKIGDLDPVYGVYLKGPGDVGSKKVILTIPIPDNIPDDMLVKSGVFDGTNMTYPYHTDPQGNGEYWSWVNNVDRSKLANRIFKVTCDDFTATGSDYMYSVLYDNHVPEQKFVENHGYVKTADGRMALHIFCRAIDEGSGISQWDLYRDGVKIAIIGDKTSYKQLSDRNGDGDYYDYDVEPGKFYRYKLRVYDTVGNGDDNAFTTTEPYVAMTDEDIINREKQYIEDGTWQFQYAPGDSADSVTQNFGFQMIKKDDPDWDSRGHLGDITWSSDRPDLLPVQTNGSAAAIGDCFVYRPLDADQATVNLTLSIKLRDAGPVTVTIPLTIKWTDEIVIGSNGIETTRDAQELLAAANRENVKTIILNNMINYRTDMDLKGKTVKPGPKIKEYNEQHPDNQTSLFDLGQDKVFKNAVLDAAGTKMNTLIQVRNTAVVDNVKFIGMENTKYAICAYNLFSPTIRNCSFTPTEYAGIFLYGYPVSYPPTKGSQTIENCTFDGGGKPGYAILDQWGNATISNCVIKGYQGKLITCCNSGNDTPSVVFYAQYTELHDGFTSAGIFVKDNGQAVLHGNSISDCDSGIKVWTGEGFKYYNSVSNGQGGYDQVLTGPITVYTTVNGTEVKDADTANTVAVNLQLDNTAANTTYGLDICTAADPDNPVPLYQGTLTGNPSAAVLTSLSVSGSPELVYSSTDISFDLSNLTLSALDQNGGIYDLNGSTVEWNVNSGPATVNGNTLTVTGCGTVEITATVGYVTSNALSLPVSNSNGSDNTVIGSYTVSSLTDDSYTCGTTADGILTMTVKNGNSGMKYFGVTLSPVTAHEGKEAVVFVQLRNGIQQSMNVTKADFDIVDTAQAGFNVQAGDIVKAYIVDDISNATDFNPTILQ